MHRKAHTLRESLSTSSSNTCLPATTSRVHKRYVLCGITVPEASVNPLSSPPHPYVWGMAFVHFHTLLLFRCRVGFGRVHEEVILSPYCPATKWAPGECPWTAWAPQQQLLDFLIGTISLIKSQRVLREKREGKPSILTLRLARDAGERRSRHVRRELVQRRVSNHLSQSESIRGHSFHPHKMDF